MNREQKAQAVEELSSQIKGAEALFAVDYRGISVAQAAELRAKLRDAGASFRIVKNSLTERAADAAGAETLKELLEGPTALTFVSGDPALAAKALGDFSRANHLLEFKGGVMNGEPLIADQIKVLARLPGREQLQGQFLGILASPLTGLVRGLASLVAGLAVQLGEIQRQGLVGGGEAATAAEPAPEEPAAEEAEEPAAEEEEQPTAEERTEQDDSPEPAEAESSAETETED